MLIFSRVHNLVYCSWTCAGAHCCLLLLCISVKHAVQERDGYWARAQPATESGDQPGRLSTSAERLGALGGGLDGTNEGAAQPRGLQLGQADYGGASWAGHSVLQQRWVRQAAVPRALQNLQCNVM